MTEMKNRNYFNDKNFVFVDGVWQVEDIKVSDYLEQFKYPLNSKMMESVLKYQYVSWEDFIFYAIDSFMNDYKCHEYNLIFKETIGRERDKYKAADAFSTEFEKNYGYVSRFKLNLKGM